MKKTLMLGNEAVARGLYEAGCRLVSSYPGTPSTEITEYAATKGVRTCTENHGFIFQDSCRVKTLIDPVGDENYRWLVDLGNFLCVDEDPLSAVKVAAPYAIHVHAKDFLYKFKSDAVPPSNFFGTRNGNYLRGTIVGHGVVPVDACMAILKDAGLQTKAKAITFSLPVTDTAGLRLVED